MEAVPYFIRFSPQLVEDARSIGMSLFQESSHKTVEATMLCVQKCLGEDDDEDENDTESPSNSPGDPDGPSRSRASSRLVHRANPGLPTASEVRAQRNQIKSAAKEVKPAKVITMDPFDDKIVMMSDKVKLENMKLKADGCALLKAVRQM